MLNIVIPMAGRGSRFSNAGYKDPKPLIKINGKRMIEVVINNLKPKCPHKFIFIVQKIHMDKYPIKEIIKKNCNCYEIVEIDGITDGAAITVLKAKDIINTDTPLMIANSDQWVDFDINLYLDDMKNRHLDGNMLTMKASDPKWSYAKLNGEYVTEVVEKVVISDEATVGIYNFSKGKDFCSYAEYMIENNFRSNNEFYVAPVYTYMAEDGKNIGIYNIGGEKNGMYGLGIPDDLDFFVKSNVIDKATQF